MFPKKFRIHAILLVSFLVIIFYPQYSRKPDTYKVTAATAAALEFLQLVDAGKYENSWQLAAEYLRNSVPLADWQEKLGKMRTDYGSLVERERTDASFTEPAKDLPDDEFIMLNFATVFKNQPEVAETVTLLLTKESGWRVVGYFIK